MAEKIKDEKHIMLSYQWNTQKLVCDVYQYLKDNGIRVWMDTKGGMKKCLSSSMAEGVENASAIVCFPTKEYQQSENCKKELTYASQRGVPIIPCMTIAGWKPSAWLGFSITDLLYLDFKNITEQNFNIKCQVLIEKIKQTVGTECFETDVQQSLSATEAQPHESKAELELELKSESEDEDEIVNTDFSSKIPEPQRQGPELVAAEQAKTTKHVCQGDSVIRLLTLGNT
ncbi:unnamed protein product, partial [Didymodactylos carnosus]